jgi:thiamine-phosphate pyrophosphorylase
VSPWPQRRPVLYLVTDRHRLADASLPSLIGRIAAAIAAGVDALQIRERDLSDRALVDLVRAVVDAARSARAPVLVNDRVDVALAAGAAGVHLRGDSVAAPRVRSMVPAGFIVGRSVHSIAEADAVAGDGGVDYLIFGTVFPSAGKSAGHRVQGESLLAEVCRRVPLPVIAIGGIDAERAPRAAAAGAAGIAAVGEFMSGDEQTMASRVRAMREAFDSGSRLV